MAKKTLGRRKIEIAKIEKRSARQVTFSKRRAGLFKYANNLCALTGAQIGLLVKSPGNRVFSFGSPSIDAVLNRFCNKATDPSPERFWWEEPVENLGIGDLQDYVAALEELKKNIVRRISMAEEDEKLLSAMSMVNGWLQDGNDFEKFVGSPPGFEKCKESCSGFECGDESSSGFEKVNSSSGLLTLDDSSSVLQSNVGSAPGFEKKFDGISSALQSFVGSPSGFETFEDFSSGLEDLVDSACGFESFGLPHHQGFDYGQAESTLLLNY